MVLVLQAVEAIPAPAAPTNTSADKVPQYATQHHLVGLISQLGTLTSYANAIFSELMNQCTSSYNRISALSGKVTSLAEQAVSETWLYSLIFHYMPIELRLF